jgi:glycosyltransferase involved in cell wall biosynthesis
MRGNLTPWIYDAHECYPEQVSQQVNSMVKWRLEELDKFLSSRAFRIITVSEVLADYFRSFNPEVYLVGNYQDTSANHRIPIITRGDYGYADDDYIVGYIGGFTPARAIIPLIEASEYIPECKIVIVGDGPRRSQLEQKLPSHPNVKYVGWVAQHVAIDLFYICDVIYYGLYSDSGNSKFSSPNSLFNAMSAKKPIISTRIGEISQIIQRENCGILIDQPVPGLIADAIRELEDASLRDQLGENGINAVRRQYNWKSAQEILESIYMDLLGE